MDIRLALMTGVPIPVPECQLAVHQPTIKELSYIGETDLFKAIQTLCFYSSSFTAGLQGRNITQEFKNFQIFMTMMNDKETADKKAAVKQLLSLCFPNETVTFSPRALAIITKDRETRMIDDTNFDAFQEALRAVFCIKQDSAASGIYNPANAKAAAIAQKIMRGRQRVAEQRESSRNSIYTQYISILSVGLKIPVNDICNYTIFQLYDQIERFQLFTNWDIDIHARIAGAKSDSHPDNWMKDIHQNN